MKEIEINLSSKKFQTTLGIILFILSALGFGLIITVDFGWRGFVTYFSFIGIFVGFMCLLVADHKG